MLEFLEDEFHNVWSPDRDSVWVTVRTDIEAKDEHDAWVKARNFCKRQKKKLVKAKKLKYEGLFEPWNCILDGSRHLRNPSDLRIEAKDEVKRVTGVLILTRMKDLRQ